MRDPLPKKPKKPLDPVSERFIRNNMHRDRHCRQAAIDYGFRSSESIKPAGDKFRENYDEIFRKK